MANKIDLYGGKVKGKRIGAFMKDGFDFVVIRPGVDIQGRNRSMWTQLVWRGVPVWEQKMRTELPNFLEVFNTHWDKAFKDNPEFALKVLEAEVRDRERHFQDGVKGNVVAPASIDGPNEPTRYAG